MENIQSILSSAALTLFGALISLLCTTIADNRKRKTEHLRFLYQEKAKTYKMISEFILIETQNNDNLNLNTYTPVLTNQLVHNIEVDMLLYVSKDIRKLFYKTYEAIEAELPHQIISGS